MTRLALEGPATALLGSERGITGALEVLVFLISQLLHWLVFGCKKQPGEAEICRRRGKSGNATATRGGFTNRGHMGCQAVAPPNSVRLIHNRGNLACCRDFKVSHYSGMSHYPGKKRYGG